MSTNSPTGWTDGRLLQAHNLIYEVLLEAESAMLRDALKDVMDGIELADVEMERKIGAIRRV